MSGLGAVPFEMDAWGVDVVVTGSQKAWMAAPGLAMIAASERGWAAMETATMPRFYLDLRSHRDAAADGQTPFTPAIAVVYQVDEGLRLMRPRARPAIFARHEACAAASRAGLQALGFELFADAARSRRRPSPPRSCPRASTGRRSTARSRPTASSSPAARASSPARSSGSATSARSRSTRSSARSPSSRRVALEQGRADRRPARPSARRPRPRADAARRRPGSRAAIDGRRRRPGVRILVAEPIAAEGVARLRADHEVDERPGLSPRRAVRDPARLRRAVVRSQVQVDAGARSPPGTRLQVIGRAGVGVDNVDLEAATRAGITVVNAPTGNTIAAAEHTLALLYGVARQIAAADASVRRGEWKRAQFTGLELRGRTLGIVGLGKIGQAIAARARAMEMTVLASDPFVTAEQAALPRRRARAVRRRCSSGPTSSPSTCR